MLNAMKDKIYAVRGNCEAEVDQMVLEFPVMADYVFCQLTARHFMRRMDMFIIRITFRLYAREIF